MTAIAKQTRVEPGATASESLEHPTAIRLAEYRLRLSRSLRSYETPQLRGFFGQRFSHAVLMHHHKPDGTLLYDYPRVQFKVIDQTAVLLGIDQGARLLESLWLEVDVARLGCQDLRVLESRIECRHESLSATDIPLDFRFLSPWLPLNQRNHAKFVALKSARNRSQLLERIMIGNVLSLAKSFGHVVQQRLVADCSKLRPVRPTLKGISMLGFVGQFRVNFRIPTLAGIGKSVSRGFGVVHQMAPTHQRM